MKHVNIVQNIAPETMPGQPAARTVAKTSPRRVTARIAAIESAAKKLRQNAISQLLRVLEQANHDAGRAPEEARADHPCGRTPVSQRCNAFTRLKMSAAGPTQGAN